ncbi:MAG: hypothetical protein RLZZ447_722 [Verrucomicrobiota bacterium]
MRASRIIYSSAFAALFVGLAAVRTPAAVVSIRDDFNRSGALTGSQPTQVVGGTLTWTEGGSNTADTFIQTNGTAAVFQSLSGSAGDREPSLDFVVPNGAITTLSGVFSAQGGTWNGVSFSGWLGMGFMDNAAGTPGIFSSSGPMIGLAGDGTIWSQASHLGTPVDFRTYSGYGASNVTLEIRIDTRDPNAITSTFLANSSVLSVYNFGSAGFVADHVFLRSYLDGGGTVDDFSLSVDDGLPAAALPACVGLLLGWAWRARRGIRSAI